MSERVKTRCASLRSSLLSSSSSSTTTSTTTTSSSSSPSQSPSRHRVGGATFVEEPLDAPAPPGTPDPSLFTWFDTRLGATERAMTNAGMRIDYILASNAMAESLVGRVDTLRHQYGSDHCPVVAEFAHDTTPQSRSREQSSSSSPPPPSSSSSSSSSSARVEQTRTVASMFAAAHRKQQCVGGASSTPRADDNDSHCNGKRSSSSASSSAPTTSGASSKRAVGLHAYFASSAKRNRLQHDEAGGL